MKLTIDMETRSKIDLKKCGLYRYAEDASTDILCIAVKVDEEPTRVWISPNGRPMYASLPGHHDFLTITFDELAMLISKADIIEAHNASFEIALWNSVMTRYGFDPLPIEKMRCSAAKAAAHALPRDLKGACEALALPIQKDLAGYRIMMKMCKPDKFGKWNENPLDFAALCKYCIQDVEAEHCLSSALKDLSPKEQEIWKLDQEINSRGVKIDLDAVDNLIYKVQYAEKNLLKEIEEITFGFIKSARQRNAVLDWLKVQGVEMEDLKKKTVAEELKGIPDGKAKRLLEIRQELAKSSVSKLDAMRRWASCRDNRARGMFLYHGASTGRWTSKGIQFQNLPRESYSEAEITRVLDGGVDALQEGCLSAASKSIRGMLIADEGKEFYCADFASIEARVLAWLAGERKVLEAFERDLDLYKVAATDIYPVHYDNVDKSQRQIGKVAVLALGYQGWVGAFKSMAEVYGIQVDEERAKEIVIAWREKNSAIVAFWAALEYAALQAIKTGKVYTAGPIKFGVKNNFLWMGMPSGRSLCYYSPRVTTIEKFGKMKEAVSFLAQDQYRGWCRCATYGGCLAENATQAVARDLLAEAMLRTNKAGYPIIITCHDEIVSEVEEGRNEFERFIELISETPGWAVGCPIKAEGWVGRRYRK
jgi:DNA polymerase bacteriophage-type